MHDIRFIRENPAAFDAGLKKRNLAPLSAELLEIDKRRRAAISESEAAQAKRKALSRQIGQAKAKGEPADALKSKRRYAIVVAFVIAAVLTPPDVVSQLALAIPLIAFYELSIVIGRWIEKKREAEDKKAEEEESKADQASS